MVKGLLRRPALRPVRVRTVRRQSTSLLRLLPLPSPHLPLGLRRRGVGEGACCSPVVKGAVAASSAAPRSALGDDSQPLTSARSLPLPSPPRTCLGLRRGGVREEACCAPVVKGAAAASSAACSASFRYGTLPGRPRQPADAGAQLLLVVVRVRIGAWQAEPEERVMGVM